MPRTVPIIVTAPDGTEYRFSSCKAAGELVGASGSNVSQQCVMGNPIHGYRVRYERINKMGQLMEVSEEHDVRYTVNIGKTMYDGGIVIGTVRGGRN